MFTTIPNKDWNNYHQYLFGTLTNKALKSHQHSMGELSIGFKAASEKAVCLYEEKSYRRY